MVRPLLPLFLLLCSAAAALAEPLYFPAQPPESPGLYDAPPVARPPCAGRLISPREVHLVLPSAGVNAETGLLLNLLGISTIVDCNPQPVALGDWADSKNLVIATISYRNLAHAFPADFGKLSIGDVLRGAGRVLEEHPQIDRRRLYLYGGSGGGHLALQVYQAAPHLWAEVHIHSAITKITVATDLEDGYLTRWNNNLRFPESQGDLSGEQWMRFQAERTLRGPQFHARKAARVGAHHPPVWMFHGDADPLVSYQHFLDYKEALAAFSGQPLEEVSPVQHALENWNFVRIAGGDHSYSGAAPDESSRVSASQKYVPDCFTRLRPEDPSPAVYYRSPPHHGYRFAVEGTDLTDTIVYTELPPFTGTGWGVY